MWVGPCSSGASKNKVRSQSRFLRAQPRRRDDQDDLVEQTMSRRQQKRNDEERSKRLCRAPVPRRAEQEPRRSDLARAPSLSAIDSNQPNFSLAFPPLGTHDPILSLVKELDLVYSQPPVSCVIVSSLAGKEGKRGRTATIEKSRPGTLVSNCPGDVGARIAAGGWRRSEQEGESGSELRGKDRVVDLQGARLARNQ